MLQLLKHRHLRDNALLQYVRRMNREDIDAVFEIDREAFPTEWPPTNLQRELNNRLAHYIVVCEAEEISAPSQAAATPPPDRTGRSIIPFQALALFIPENRVGGGASRPRPGDSHRLCRYLDYGG